MRLRRPMEGKGVAPDVVAYSTAIKACGDGWQWELAIVLPQSSVSWPPGDGEVVILTRIGILRIGSLTDQRGDSTLSDNSTL